MKVAALEARALFKTATHLPASFWALVFYFFFEYVRPQTVYPALDVLPFAWLALAIAAAAALNEADGTRRWCSVDTTILVYALVLFASLVFAYDRARGVDMLNVFLNWMLVYALLAAALHNQNRLLLFLLGWMLWNLKMSLFAVRAWVSIGFAFRDWGVGGAPGWFQNSGEFGIEMCVVMPISLYFALGLRPHISRMKFLALLTMPVTAVVGSIASSSRGALLGMSVIALWMLARSKYKVRSFVTLIVAGAIFLAIIPPEQISRISSSGSDRTSVTRLTYWRHGIEIAKTHPVLGVGYGSWVRYYGEHYPPPVQLPHNIFIECVSELGFSGLIVLILLIAGSFTLNRRTRALARRFGSDGHFPTELAWGFDGAMIGFVVSGSFVTVLYYPYLWVNLGFTVALHLAVRRSSQVGAAMRSVPTIRQSSVGFGHESMTTAQSLRRP